MIVGYHEFGRRSGSCRPPSRATPARPTTRGRWTARPGAPAAARPRRWPRACPAAHGNDGGGSIRIPAACCGLVGLKPSRGRVSSGPDLGDSWLAANGVLTRTVADTAIALDVLGGYEVGDANWAPRPIEPYVTALRRSPGKLRVAVTATNPFDAAVDPEAIHGLRIGAELLAALGHEVVEASPAWPAPDALEIFIDVFGPAIALGINASVRRKGREPEEDELEPLSSAIYQRRETPRRSRTSAPSRRCRRSRAGWSPSSPTTIC